MKYSIKIISLLSLSIAIGKAQAQSVVFSNTGTVQTWTVPSCATSITITAEGGAGGTNLDGGGDGAIITATFTPVPGDVLSITVGDIGQSGIWDGGGGGGGSFVWDNASTTLPLIAAGGGGGGGYSSVGNPGSTTTVPTTIVGETGAGGSGGTAGALGNNTPAGAGGGGGGWLTVATVAPGSAKGGIGAGEPAVFAYGLGATGGSVICNGGFGGGGGGGYSSSSTYGAGGGGGGYNGGGGGDCNSGTIQYGGGGGGSYVNPSGATLSVAATNTGAGSVSISWVTGFVPATDTGKVISNVTCNGENNGIASALVTGGAPSTFTYSWAPLGQTTDTVTGLSTGTYTVSIASPCGATASATVTITQPNILTVTGNVISNVTCFENNNGIVSANVNGGNAPYTYSWAPSGGNNDTAIGLSAGIYRVTVWDMGGCSASTTVTITQPNPLTTNALNTSNASCGINNGSATSTVGGGTAPYTYSWTGGGTSFSTTGLSGGTYLLTVTDNNGCMATSPVIIGATPAVYISAFTSSNIVCNGDNVGAALSNVTGGVPPYSYLWNNGETNFGATGLSAGTYTVNVTDVNGCTSSAEATISEPPPIQVDKNSTSDNGHCTGSVGVVVSGGVAPYSYLWSDGNTNDFIDGLCSNTYCCVITDANKCIDNVCITVKSTSGIDGVTSKEEQISIYPNPSNGQFTFGFNKYVTGTVEIYDIAGRKVYQQTVQSSTVEVNLGEQTTGGMYFYRVISATGSLIGEGKLVVEK